MIKKLVFFLFLLLIVSATFVGCADGQKESYGAYVQSAEEFYAALQNKEAVIRVGDLTFAEETKIQLNYGLTIIGNGSGATIKNAFFNVIGPNTAGETIDVVFDGIIFDGGHHNALPEERDKSFEDIFESEREDKRCINPDWGYVNLSLKNCGITGYAAVDGSAVHIGNTFHEGEQTFTLENCRIYGNIARNGTVKVYNNKLTTSISDCLFYDNTAGAAAGFVISNGRATIENCKIENNVYFPFADLAYEERGGGAYLGGVDAEMKNCVIRNNETVSGGGLAVVSAMSGNGKTLLQNCRVENNRAENGGAVFVDSLQGQPIDFIGCEFYGNEASVKGSILYAEPYAYWTKKYNGGQINLLFCSAANNAAPDKGTFCFYEANELAGYIVLRGCLMLDESEYAPKGNYNYVTTAKKALEDGAVVSVTVSENESLKAVKGSSADIVVPAEIYSGWHAVFASATADHTIGEYRQPIVRTPVIGGLIGIFIVIAVIVLSSVAIITVIVTKKKKAPESRVIG
ncbi:MAG: hypothetical protein J6Z34_04800, partial [Clostridia bacterium]|nr:hypothetical protein [Clostridia bacterium]